jgi:hypothetical protein
MTQPIDTSPARLRELAGTCEEIGFPNIRKSLLAVAAEKEAQPSEPALVDVPLPEPVWPKEFFGSLPRGAYSADQMLAHREAYAQAKVAAERERLCAAIKAADDEAVEKEDYMLDSDDCIKVVRGTWNPDYELAAKKGTT